MKSILKLIFIGFVLLPVLLSGQNSEYDNVNRTLENRGEAVVEVFGTEAQLSEVARYLSFDKKNNPGSAIFYINTAGFLRLQESGLEYVLLPSPADLAHLSTTDVKSPEDIENWDFYPDYDSYIEIVNGFADTYPGLCTVYSIGKTVEGRDLMMIRISDNAGRDPGEPSMLFTSSIHGDELAGYVLMLHLADYLLENYTILPQVTRLVDSLDIWINPLANPDGAYFAGNNSVSGAKRFNANNVDINRNFPDPEDGPHPDGNAWQPETEAFMALAGQQNFTMAVNFHGGAEVFNYPWDTWSKLHADDAWWYETGRRWADTVHQYGPPGYFTFLDNGVTNGYQWYSISGGRQDYMNYFHHCREVTLEISNIKLLPENQLEVFWEYNYRSFLNYMNQSLTGLKGMITDSVTGQPLAASIEFAGHDIDNSWVVSSNEDGWYFRPAMDGTYTVLVYADGYAPKTIEAVQLSMDSSKRIDFALSPSASGIDLPENSGITGWFDPAAGEYVFQSESGFSANCSVILSDVSGKVWEPQLFFSADNCVVRFALPGDVGRMVIIRLRDDNYLIIQKLIRG
ncbi:MAG: hypothetical protein Kow00127_13200 [Bacteroidales bacterium]